MRIINVKTIEGDNVKVNVDNINYYHPLGYQYGDDIIKLDIGGSVFYIKMTVEQLEAIIENSREL